MQATNTRPRFEPTADAHGICSHAGVVLLAALADRLGLTHELGRRANLVSAYTFTCRSAYGFTCRSV